MIRFLTDENISPVIVKYPYPLHTHYGIIRIRIHPPLIEDIIESFEKFSMKIDLSAVERTLIILEKDGFRVR